jgi:hypothetical protein
MVCANKQWNGSKSNWIKLRRKLQSTSVCRVCRRSRCTTSNTDNSRAFLPLALLRFGLAARSGSARSGTPCRALCLCLFELVQHLLVLCGSHPCHPRVLLFALFRSVGRVVQVEVNAHCEDSSGEVERVRVQAVFTPQHLNVRPKRHLPHAVPATHHGGSRAAVCKARVRRMHRHRHSQTQAQTHKNRHIHRDMATQPHTHTHTHRLTHTHTQTDTHTHTQTDTHTHTD